MLQLIDRAKRDNLYKETIRIYDHDNKEIYFSGDTTRFLDPNSFDNVRKFGELTIEKSGFDVIGVLTNPGLTLITFMLYRRNSTLMLSSKVEAAALLAQ